MGTQAISLGQPVELSRRRDPYQQVELGILQVWPLQLVYHDIAWYLVYEDYPCTYFAINRMDRFSSHCRVLQETGRGASAQQASLQQAGNTFTVWLPGWRHNRAW